MSHGVTCLLHMFKMTHLSDSKCICQDYILEWVQPQQVLCAKSAILYVQFFCCAKSAKRYVQFVFPFCKVFLCKVCKKKCTIFLFLFAIFFWCKVCKKRCNFFFLFAKSFCAKSAKRNVHFFCPRYWNESRDSHARYGVATISSLLKIIGLFCKRAL